MPKFTGHYAIDLEASAKLHVGYFTDRFAMKPGYEEAMRADLHANGDTAKKFTLTLDPTSLRLKKDNEEEVFPVKSLIEDGEKATLVVTVAGRICMSYELQELGPGLVHFSNRRYDLHNWAWRKTEGTSTGDVVRHVLTS